MPVAKYSAKRRDGQRCQARTIDGAHCLFHSEKASVVRARQLGRSSGGLQRAVKGLTLPNDAPDVVFETPRDIVCLLAQTISRVQRGQLSTQVASCVASLASVARATMQPEQLQLPPNVEFVLHVPSDLRIPCGRCLEKGEPDTACGECKGSGFLLTGEGAN